MIDSISDGFSDSGKASASASGGTSTSGGASGDGSSADGGVGAGTSWNWGWSCSFKKGFLGFFPVVNAFLIAFSASRIFEQFLVSGSGGFLLNAYCIGLSANNFLCEGFLGLLGFPGVNAWLIVGSAVRIFEQFLESGGGFIGGGFLFKADGIGLSAWGFKAGGGGNDFDCLGGTDEGNEGSELHIFC